MIVPKFKERTYLAWFWTWPVTLNVHVTYLKARSSTLFGYSSWSVLFLESFYCNLICHRHLLPHTLAPENCWKTIWSLFLDTKLLLVVLMSLKKKILCIADCTQLRTFYGQNVDLWIENVLFPFPEMPCVCNVLSIIMKGKKWTCL